jgi:hypothetical protein
MRRSVIWVHEHEIRPTISRFVQPWDVDDLAWLRERETVDDWTGADGARAIRSTPIIGRTRLSNTAPRETREYGALDEQFRVGIANRQAESRRRHERAEHVGASERRRRVRRNCICRWFPARCPDPTAGSRRAGLSRLILSVAEGARGKPDGPGFPRFRNVSRYSWTFTAAMKFWTRGCDLRT